MDLLNFTIDNLALLGTLTMEHISLVALAVGLAILTGVPIGILITQNERVAKVVLYVASIIITIPSIALFGLMIPLLSTIGHGIGYVPAVITVLLYSQLPYSQHLYRHSQRRTVTPRGSSRHRDDAFSAFENGGNSIGDSGDYGGCENGSSNEYWRYGDRRVYRSRRARRVYQPRHLAK